MTKSMTGSQPDKLLPHANLINSKLRLLSSPDLQISAPACETLCTTLDFYLEIPTLLDPQLPTLIPTLCKLITERLNDFCTTPPQTTNNALLQIELPCHVLYTAAKVRGVKSLSRHLPHQVADLHNLTRHILFIESHARHRLWRIRYVLFYWASIAIRLPFPLASLLDSSDLSALVTRARTALKTVGPVSVAAAAFLARLLSRRDAKPQRNTILTWATTDGISPAATAATRAAALTLLAAVFKLAHRDDLRPFVTQTLSALRPLSFSPESQATADVDTTEAHLIAKLSGRLALAVLPPKLAAWRYQRGERVIFARSVQGDVTRHRTGTAGHTGEVDAEVDTGIDDESADTLEAVIEHLLLALQHRDTVVRWSAAKGVGRVTGRLPLVFAQDVVDSVIDLFEHVSEARTDAAWHGGCLALAELARRGVLLPKEMQFRMAFKVIAKAASFDQRRGANSVGAHVRDAACYAVWAIARAYAKEEVAPFASSITESMLPVALLDREVNCRRAAAAALQECVGRLSEELFPDGIQIITIADYFALGDRVAAYLSLAPKVAQLAGGAHFDCIVHELATKKLMHWDSNIRSLSARAIAGLVGSDSESVIASKVLPDLVQLTTKKGDVVVRNGSVLGVAELAIVLGAAGLGAGSDQVRAIPRTLKERRLLTGRTGDEMRMACCHLLRNLATSATEVYTQSPAGRADAEFGLEFLEAILGCGKEGMYAEAASAYFAICESVIAIEKEWHVKVTRRILQGISEGLFERRRGYVLAAGVCGASAASGEVVTVLSREITRSKDVETRRNSALSLGRLPRGVLQEHLVRILDALSAGMNDYATDERGDIGSWVREASMTSSSKIVEALAAAEVTSENNQRSGEAEAALLRVLRGVVRQCCGRIDRTRAVAGSSLAIVCKILANEPNPSSLTTVCRAVADCFHIAIRSDAADNKRSISFADAESVFPAVGKALEIEELSGAVLTGLVSAGGGLGHQSNAALDALIERFQSSSEQLSKQKLLQAIVQIITEGEARLAIPAFVVLEAIAKRGCLDDMDRSALIEVAKVVRSSWRKKLKDVRRTAAAVRLLGELAAVSLAGLHFDFGEGTLGRECLEALVIVLGGPIPRLRRITAECIYMVLIEFAGDDDELLDDVGTANACPTVRDALDVLLDTEWEMLDTLGARERRNLICTLLHIRAPVTVSKSTPSAMAPPC